MDDANILYVACASLSVIGTSVMMGSFLLSDKLRNPSTTFVFLLAVSDFGSSVPFYITDHSGSLCQIQAATMTFFQLSSILWTVVIARFMYDVTVRMMSPRDASRLGIYCFCVYGFPLVATVLPFSTHNYGSTGSWCWITESSRGINDGLLYSYGVWWRMVCFYFPLWIAIAHNTYIYYLISAKLNNVADNSLSAENSHIRIGMLSLVRKLKWYPVSMALCYAGASILRIYNFVSNGGNIYWLEVFAGASGNMLGFFDFLVYGYGSYEIWITEANFLTQSYLPCCFSLTSGPVDDVTKPTSEYVLDGNRDGSSTISGVSNPMTGDVPPGPSSYSTNDSLYYHNGIQLSVHEAYSDMRESDLRKYYE